MSVDLHVVLALPFPLRLWFASWLPLHFAAVAVVGFGGDCAGSCLLFFLVKRQRLSWLSDLPLLVFIQT